MKAGVIRADGATVTTAQSTDKVVIQRLDSNSGQFEPRVITVGNLLTGADTGFTEGSVPFVNANGDLDQDNSNLNFNNSTNVLTVGGDLNAGGNLQCTVAGKGLNVTEGSNARMGTATLVAGTVTVSNTSVTADTRIFLTRYAAGASTEVGVLTVGTVVADTSFVISALDPSDASVATGDISVVHWMLVEALS